MSQRESAFEVGIGGQGRGEPEAQPPDFPLGRKVQVVESDSIGGRGGAFLSGSPVNKCSFRYRNRETLGSCDSAEGAVLSLKKLSVTSVGEGRNCDHKLFGIRGWKGIPE